MAVVIPSGWKLAAASTIRHEGTKDMIQRHGESGQPGTFYLALRYEGGGRYSRAGERHATTAAAIAALAAR